MHIDKHYNVGKSCHSGQIRTHSIATVDNMGRVYIPKLNFCNPDQIWFRD